MAWVVVDARARDASRYWVAGVAIAGPIALAAYLAVRPLRHGESREGGHAWQFLSRLVVSWTALIAVAALWNALVGVVDWGVVASAWAFVSMPALAVGLSLKRNAVEYRAGAGATSMPSPSCERTADGRAYICRECGKEYPVELPFCDGCGAWPGDSG